MNLEKQAKLDNALMKLLKIIEIRHVIAHTSHGDLCLVLMKGDTEADYFFVLDSVPFDEKTNKQLIDYYTKLKAL